MRGELNAIAQQIFAQGAPADLTAMVARQWALLDMDRVVDRAVAAAVDQAQRNETMVNTALSGWSPARAEELTGTVAELAFASEEFRAALDDLSAAVALDLETQLGHCRPESASLNLLCLQQFIARQYSSSVVTAFAENVCAGADDVAYTPGDEVDGGLAAVLQQHKPPSAVWASSSPRRSPGAGAHGPGHLLRGRAHHQACWAAWARYRHPAGGVDHRRRPHRLRRHRQPGRRVAPD
ncbi:MAG: hypothetical protein R2838_00960 [Caldilineaceae bacterium]